MVVQAQGCGTLTLNTAPEVEPVTTAQAKTHLRITAADDDTYIDSLVESARVTAETITSRALINQTWNYYLDSFPGDNFLELPLSPLSSITSIAYTDSDGTVTTMTLTTDYLVDTDSDPGRIVLPFNVQWPTPTLHPVNPIKVIFVAGYGAAGSNVPEPINSAIKLMVADMYEIRQQQFTGITTGAYDTVANLLAPYKAWTCL